ncbi:MAG: AmmeMemoRadiSam system protein B [Spirochaetales bacterium]|nr:AmmeMemoRadiSam system protein B [Spirochaetales bacterium]
MDRRTDFFRGGLWLFLLLLPFHLAAQEVAPDGEETLFIRANYHNDRPMWDHIVSAKEPLPMEENPRGVIIPHHAMVARDIGSVYSALAERIEPKTIFLLSPNHFELTDHSVVTGRNLIWETVYGDLETDKDLVDDLLEKGLATDYDPSFVPEHGVFFHAPFIKHFFPEAKIVPLLFHWKNDRAENDRIAEWLYNNMDEESFVIASVDFSHYQPAVIADFHDEGTEISLTGFNPEALYDREIDSPSSVYTLMKLMEKEGSTRAVRLQHTNSDRVLGYKEPMTTSHQYYVFYEGTGEAVEGFTVLVAGDQLQESEKIPSRTYWEWDREAPPVPEGSDFLARLRGVEDRFFMGADLCLLDLPSQAEELDYRFHSGALKLFVVREENRDVPRLSERIAETALGGDESIILVYETEEEEDESTREAYRRWSEAGADVIIRRGPGSYYHRELGKTHLISGLGPFIGGEDTDQAMMAGLVFRNGTVQVREIPLRLRGGYPEFHFTAE